MGCCINRCLPESDMATELETELEEHRLEQSLLNTNIGKGSMSSGSPLLATGDVICLHPVGQGTSGTVFKGSYRGSIVAVKRILLYSALTTDQLTTNVENLLEIEAVRMGSLRHPNIVLFMGACLHDKYFCIISEFCTRGSLFDVLRTKGKEDSRRSTSVNRVNHSSRNVTCDVDVRGLLDWNLRLRLALGASRGLLYLHSADPPLVHGDIKSTNILVDDSWNAKLADFGTRRAAEVVGSQGNREFEDIEKNMDSDVSLVRWTAPELLRVVTTPQSDSGAASNAYPQAVDIYSFGMVMWELTTGIVPFVHLNSNEDITEAVLRGQRPPIPSGLCRPNWADLMTRCMAHSPHDRPSASEVVALLEDFSRSDGVDNSLIGVRSVQSVKRWNIG